MLAARDGHLVFHDARHDKRTEVSGTSTKPAIQYHCPLVRLCATDHVKSWAPPILVNHPEPSAARPQPDRSAPVSGAESLDPTQTSNAPYKLDLSGPAAIKDGRTPPALQKRQGSGGELRRGRIIKLPESNSNLARHAQSC